MLILAPLFTEKMVLQRGKEIPVWGTAAPGAAVTVTLQGKSYTAPADETGAFTVKIGPLTPSRKETFTVTSDGETITFTEVMVGDVWLAGGQSNMEFQMQYDADYASELENCEALPIRFYDVPEISYPEQIDEADYGKEYGYWRPCDKENLRWFSAVGYHFAKEIAKSENVPVGIVGCNWGGTTACAWMSKAAIKKGGGQIWLDDYAKATENLDLDAYNKAFYANLGFFRTDLLADKISDRFLRGLTKEQQEELLAGMPGGLTQLIGPKYERRPTALYESMLARTVPYGLTGFIWYQGESDADHPDVYHTMMQALIEDWRALWGEALPFYFVQLAPYTWWMGVTTKGWIEVRNAQQWVADNVPGTGMAVITDAGMEWDIHPKEKHPVGRRLALLARKNTYGEDLLCEAPRLSATKKANGLLTLTFDHAGDGLTIRGEKLTGITVLVNGAAIAGNPAASGNTLTIADPAITPDAAVTVEIGWGDYSVVNLYNSAGIPARPARMEG